MYLKIQEYYKTILPNYLCGGGLYQPIFIPTQMTTNIGGHGQTASCSANGVEIGVRMCHIDRQQTHAKARLEQNSNAGLDSGSKFEGPPID